jgi:hypothetical protein
MARGITDATTCLETSDMAGHYLGGKRTGTGLREYAFSNVDDGGGV